MADEYGNLEVGLEILTSESEDLPKIITEHQAVYSWHERTTVQNGQTVTLSLVSDNPLPNGYSISGIRNTSYTKTVYDASTESGKTNYNYAFIAELEAMELTGRRNHRALPESVDGVILRTQATAVPLYTEITIWFALEPTGA